MKKKLEIMLPTETSKEGIAKEVIGLFKKNWKVSRNYNPKSFVTFKEKQNPFVHPVDEPAFEGHSYYLTELVYASRANDTKTLEKIEGYELGLNEIRKWNNKGGLCIYTSVLLYKLLTTPGYSSINPKQVKFHQGFYIHDVIPGSLLSMVASRKVGLHAFLTFNDAVLDVSIQQIYDEYDLMEPAFFYGKFPPNTTFYGYEETEKIINKYLYRILKDNGLTEEEWLDHHMTCAVNLVRKQADELAANLKERRNEVSEALHLPAE
ncbi:hypothetical protein ACQKJG_18460 [Priestia megaterium]|uniref:hypothetical protein n=1 Tax=Priestia megaterium TaxID=1404 RepID=UPI003CFDE4A6